MIFSVQRQQTMLNSRFKKIAITPPDTFDEEVSFINTILDAGWDYVHLRHPIASLTEIRNIIESIPRNNHCRIKLHGHFELINEFNLGGLHLNRRCPTPPVHYVGKLSRSCHSIDETADIDQYEYVTLSPICDSISKAGYKSTFSAEELKSIPSRKIIALGGITTERLDYIMQYPFAGIAILGYLFNSKDTTELKQRITAIDNKLTISNNTIQHATIHNSPKQEI